MAVKLTKTEIRPSIDVEFEHPEYSNQENNNNYDNLEQQLINDGLIIGSNTEISEDELTKTKIQIFPTAEAAARFVLAIHTSLHFLKEAYQQNEWYANNNIKVSREWDFNYTV